MVALEWGLINPPYESGVDRGVIDLYHAARPWNGLISVVESEVDSSELKSYFSGFSYVNKRFGGIYQADVTAYGFVEEFEELLGHEAVFPGFILTGQPRPKFNLSYRTMVGETDYKIHLVYNAVIAPAGRSYSTLNASAQAEQRQWKISTLPVLSSSNRPSSHYVVDSSRISSDILTKIEKLIYGSSLVDPEFPTPQQIINLF
jgi:hypothetical protein